MMIREIKGNGGMGNRGGSQGGSQGGVWCFVGFTCWRKLLVCMICKLIVGQTMNKCVNVSPWVFVCLSVLVFVCGSVSVRVGVAEFVSGCLFWLCV